MPDEHDPYGIVPDSFVDDYDAETFEEALRKAEEATTTTPDSEQPRCPDCGSKHIIQKNSRKPCHNRIETNWKCLKSNCLHHFDEPADPIPFVHYEPDHNFEWLSPDELEEKPDPGFSDDLPDWPHGTRAEATRRAILLSKPWSDTDGLSLRRTAEFTPYTRAFVNSRRQEWRQGEHRHLVPSPEPAATPDGQLAADGGTNTQSQK